MSFQTRLGSLITAIGADIKALFANKADLSGASFTGEVSIATSGTPSSLSITKNANPTLTPLGDAGNLATLTGKDGKAARFILDAYGGNANVMYRRANGTALSPTALISGDYIGNVAFFGHDGITHHTSANSNIVGYATDTWSASGRGCGIKIATTPNGGTTNATPRYSFTHTAFFTDTNNSVTLGTSSSKWLESHVTSSYVYGKLDVTASGTEPALKVTQTGTGNALEILDEAGDTTPFIVTADGTLLIGTETDNGVDKLQVAGSASVTGEVSTALRHIANQTGTALTAPSSAVFYGAKDGAPGAALVADSYGATAQLILRSTGGTAAAQTTTTNGKYFFNMVGYGHNGTAMSSAPGVQIAGIATEDWTTGANGAYIKFRVTVPGTAVGYTAADLTHNSFTPGTSDVSTLGSATYRWLESHVTNAYVYGTFKLSGGSPSVGKVLTSSADGTGTWESLGTMSAQAADSVAITGGTADLDGLSVSGATQTVLISRNATAPQPPPVNVPLHIAGADGLQARVLTDAYGSVASGLFRRANGTAAAPTGVLAGQQIGTLQAFGHDNGEHSTSSDVAINLIAAENFTQTAKGTKVAVAVKPIGSLIIQTVVDFFHDRIQPGADSARNLGSATYRWLESHVVNSYVYGAFKLSSGTPGVGKVLTSDAAGVGTWQTPSGGAGVTWKSATLDLGTVPVYSKALTIADASATTTSKINIVHAPVNDEAEMDVILPTAVCLVNGTITVYVHAVPGPVTGNHNFNYFLG